MLSVALASGSGCCAPLHQLPDDCAAVVYECDLARLIHNVCSGEPLPACASGVECGTVVGSDCGTVVEELYESYPEPIYESIAPRRRYEVGPPPVTYKPLMPAKFLPVPTQPVFSPSQMLSTPGLPSTVEVGFGPQLTFPGQE